MDKSIPTNRAFSLFRYQILPLSQVFQLNISSDITSIDELKAAKNALFGDALERLKHLIYGRGELAHKVLMNRDGIFVIQLGHRKTVRIRDREFKPIEVDDWPNTIVLINNDPAVQLVAIKVDRSVFMSSETVSKILEDNLSRVLRRYNLGVYLEPVFEERVFWEFVERYPKTIIQATFELVSPNLSNISKNLKIDLGQLNRDTNTHKTRIELNSDRSKNLTLDKKNELVTSLLEYSAAGGGTPTLKVKGIKRKIKINKAVTEIAIDEVAITGKDPDEVVKILKEILN